MYFSRIELTEAVFDRSQLGMVLRDRSYAIHRLLWDLFENGQRFLFREENASEQLQRSRARPLYYVVSSEPPTSKGSIFDVVTKPYEPLLRQGDRLSFRLRANPTVSRKDGSHKNSKRHDVVMNAQREWLQAECIKRQLAEDGKKKLLRQRLLNHPDFMGRSGALLLSDSLDEAVRLASHAWLIQRGEKHGFTVESVETTGYRWNALPEKNRDAGFSSMDYEGVLTVTEPSHFVAMLGNGLGPAKAFGCGLMMVRRN